MVPVGRQIVLIEMETGEDNSSVVSVWGWYQARSEDDCCPYPLIPEDTKRLLEIGLKIVETPGYAREWMENILRVEEPSASDQGLS